MATTAKIAYQSVAIPAVTTLNGMANDTTQLVGAQCALIDNSSVLADDFQVQFDLKMSGSAINAGQILIYMGATFTNSLWSGGLSGADATKTLVAEQRALLTPIAIIPFNNTVSAVYTYLLKSVRDAFGTMPLKFNFWFTQNSNQALNAAGNVISAYPIYYQNI